MRSLASAGNQHSIIEWLLEVRPLLTERLVSGIELKALAAKLVDRSGWVQ